MRDRYRSMRDRGDILSPGDKMSPCLSQKLNAI